MLDTTSICGSCYKFYQMYSLYAGDQSLCPSCKSSIARDHNAAAIRLDQVSAERAKDSWEKRGCCEND